MKLSELKKLVREVIKEMADPAKIDPKLFPTKLSQVDPETAKKLANNPKPTDVDTAQGRNDGGPANEFYVSQTTMDFNKFVGMAINMICKKEFNGPGGDLAAIVSSDNHIMDGHHRWAATCMLDPSAQVTGLKVELPGKELVGVLNVWTIANGGVGKGSDTDMSALTPEAVAQRFKELASKGGGQLASPEDILKACKDNHKWNSLDVAAEAIKKNWESTSKNRKIEGWMPAKIDMPAIERDQLETVKQDIESGKLDLNPPFDSIKGGTTKPTEKPAEKPAEKEPIQEVKRLQQLAGIIKG